MRNSKSAFTLVELLVVITIIVILLAMLAPGLEQAVEQARVARCAAHMRQVATGWFLYTQQQQGSLPGVKYQGSGTGRVRDFANPQVFRTVPNPLGSVVPLFGGGRTAFRCPSALPISADLDPTGQYAPTDMSDGSYFPNGVVFAVKLPQVPRPGDIVFMQENLFRSNSIWYRPCDRNLNDANEVYNWWQFKRDGWRQEYSSVHNAGGNMAYGDGHVEYRKGPALLARDFALTGGAVTGNATDTQSADSDLTYAPDF